MSGHSKWSTIKRKKAAADAKRGQLFTKLARELTVAARQGGGDPEANVRLRLAVDKARQANMPKENIERAVQRGTGELKGAELQEIFYEGYAPHGVALILATFTDNRNRAVAEIRRTLERNGGHLGELGSVTWLFESKGLIVVEGDGDEAERAALKAIDAGADDVVVDGQVVSVYTAADDLMRVRGELEGQGLTVSSADLTMVPKSYAQLEEEESLRIMRLIDDLEELDDVQQVFSNLDISEAVMARFERFAERANGIQ
ncbi:MAG: YebC/PmpR family DNA-binding transcriptional regulator [Anaerolineae bacterium]